MTCVSLYLAAIGAYLAWIVVDSVRHKRRGRNVRLQRRRRGFDVIGKQ